MKAYCKECNMTRNFYPEREGNTYKGKITCWKANACNHTYTEKEIEENRVVIRYFLPNGTELTFPKPPKGNIILKPPKKDKI